MSSARNRGSNVSPPKMTYARFHAVDSGRPCSSIAPHPLPGQDQEGGSATRLNRSSNRRSGSPVAHWCSLAWISSTLASASSSVGQGASVFTVDLLAFHFPLLICCLPSPCSRLSQPRTTTRPPPRPGAISRRRACPSAARLGGGEGGVKMVPVFTTHRLTGLAPSSSPAASLRLRRRLSPGPPGRPKYRRRSRPSQLRNRRALRPGPYPPGWSRCELEGVRPLVSLVTPSRLACRTRAVWQCRPVPSLSGLLPPFPASPGSGCPQLRRPAATARWWGPFIPTGYRSASRRTQWWLRNTGRPRRSPATRAPGSAFMSSLGPWPSIDGRRRCENRV